MSVYCRKRVGTINPKALAAAIHERVAGFSHLYAQEDPADALARLRVERYPGPSTHPLLHLHYLADDMPVVLDCVGRKAEVAGYVGEYLEEGLRGRKGKSVTLVRNHLAGVAQIFSFCLKQRHADGMGTPLTYAAAAWLAERGEGLVRIDEQGWARLTEDGDFAIVLPDR